MEGQCDTILPDIGYQVVAATVRQRFPRRINRLFVHVLTLETRDQLAPVTNLDIEWSPIRRLGLGIVEIEINFHIIRGVGIAPNQPLKIENRGAYFPLALQGDVLFRGRLGIVFIVAVMWYPLVMVGECRDG